MDIETLKNKIDTVLQEESAKSQRQLSDLENKIKSRAITLDNLDNRIAADELKLAQVEKIYKEKNTELVKALLDEKTEWDIKRKKYAEEEERIRVERNQLTMDSNIADGFRRETERLDKEAAQKYARIKFLIEELSKVL